MSGCERYEVAIVLNPSGDDDDTIIVRILRIHAQSFIRVATSHCRPSGHYLPHLCDYRAYVLLMHIQCQNLISVTFDGLILRSETFHTSTMSNFDINNLFGVKGIVTVITSGGSRLSLTCCHGSGCGWSEASLRRRTT